MQISENWLREWVDPQLTTDELAHQITMAGLEVDGIEAAAPDFSGVVVAEVVKTDKHPNADSLTVCEVNDGSEAHQVVCGAGNVRAGLRVPFARVGAVLPGDFKIKKAKLRGEASFGMLCGASEIGLEDKIDGLLELPGDAPLGADIRDYLRLNDQVIDVDLTPNRADCLSVRGVAREVAALNQLPFNEPDAPAVDAVLDEQLKVKLDAPAACPRYVGRVIRDVDACAETPLWLEEKLRRAGLRSVDLVVDVTNYVLLELGQPLHAFDLDKLSGGIQVRMARQGETLTLLNEQQLELDDDTLVIADDQRALALAGIMGGADSAVTAATQHIFLESAFFAPLAIAGRARRYGLHTDSSHRFERGVDWQLQAAAIERATALIVELAGGKPGPLTETLAEKELPQLSQVTLRPERVNELLALSLDADDMIDMLERLGFGAEQLEADAWQLTAPSWRFDIAYEEDLVEEVARIYGYDRLPSRMPASAASLSHQPEGEVALRQQADLLVARGYRESISYSFVEPGVQQQLTPEQSAPALLNPISADMSVMRTSLWAGLLKAAAYNLNRQVESLRLFESGLRFIEQGDELLQQKMLAGLCYGQASLASWQGKPRQLDFYDLKGDVEALLELTGAAGSYRFVAGEHATLHPGQTALLCRGEEEIGYLGRIHPAVAKSLGVSADIYLFELRLDGLQQKRLPAFAPLSDQPAVTRDLAFVLDEAVAAASVVASLQQHGPDSLRSVEVFDVYQGEHLPQGKKSLALSLVFQHATETLKEVEINAGVDRMVLELKQEFNAQLRD